MPEVPVAVIEQWFTKWLAHHQKIHPAGNYWRNLSGDYWNGVKNCFAQYGVTELDARSISELMTVEKINVFEHRPFIYEHVKRISKPPVVASREEIGANGGWGWLPDEAMFERDASLGCPECCDCFGDRSPNVPTGFAVRMARHPAPTRVTSLFSSPMFCRCPLGRWRAERQRNSDRPPEYDDLQAHPHLWSVHHECFTHAQAPSVAWGDDIIHIANVRYISPQGGIYPAVISNRRYVPDKWSEIDTDGVLSWYRPKNHAFSVSDEDLAIESITDDFSVIDSACEDVSCEDVSCEDVSYEDVSYEDVSYENASYENAVCETMVTDSGVVIPIGPDLSKLYPIPDVRKADANKNGEFRRAFI